MRPEEQAGKNTAGLRQRYVRQRKAMRMPGDVEHLSYKDRVGVVRLERRRLQGGPYYGFSVPKAGLEESWRKIFWKSM